ncbi:MAG: SDR family oxidoreductase [Anaerolineales bacterium]|nr:SDR family oxidoreductase [Anaerolineales bacterium]
MIDTGLKSKVVRITGADNPPGVAAAARACRRAGALVDVSCLRLAPEGLGIQAAEAHQAAVPGLPLHHGLRARTAAEVVRSTCDAGGRAEAYEADLADLESVPQFFDWVEASLGPVAILVDNAAYREGPNILFHHLRQRPGARPCSEQAHPRAAQVFAGQIGQSAGKAILETFTRSPAIEVGLLGIPVNTVAPGPVQTGTISSGREENLLAADIADGSVFPASAKAAWPTGQVVWVSGGHAL